MSSSGGAELQVVLIRNGIGESWGLQLEFQLFRSKTRGHSAQNEEQWGCFAVVDMRPQSPAFLSQLQIGDFIVGVDGKRIASATREDFAELLAILHASGSVVLLTVARGGKPFAMDLHFDGDDDGVRAIVESCQSIGASRLRFLKLGTDPEEALGDNAHIEADHQPVTRASKSEINKRHDAPAKTLTTSPDGADSIASEGAATEEAPIINDPSPDEDLAGAAKVEEPNTKGEEETTMPDTEVEEDTTKPDAGVEEDTTMPDTEVEEDTTKPDTEVEEVTTKPDTEVEEDSVTPDTEETADASNKSDQEAAGEATAPEAVAESATSEASNQRAEDNDSKVEEDEEEEGFSAFVSADEEKEGNEDEVESSAAYRLKFIPLDDDACTGARFAGCIDRTDGSTRDASYSPLKFGDVLVAIDNDFVVHLAYADLLARLRRSPPLSLSFVRAATVSTSSDGGSESFMDNKATRDLSRQRSTSPSSTATKSTSIGVESSPAENTTKASLFSPRRTLTRLFSSSSSK